LRIVASIATPCSVKALTFLENFNFSYLLCGEDIAICDILALPKNPTFGKKRDSI
jgi:hypothetical protein